MNSADEAILSRLLGLKDRLQTLKKNRSTFIKTEDVNAIYSELVEQISQVLDNHPHDNLPAKIDAALDDVFQLMSLALLTIGHNRKAPATFASLCTVHRLLEHLNESTTYTDADIAPIKERLRQIEEIVERDAEDEDPQTITLLNRKIAGCTELLDRVQKSLIDIDPALTATMQRLVFLRREIMSICSKPKFSPSSLKPLSKELQNLEAQRVDGKFVNPDTGEPYRGQAAVSGLLEKCHTLIADFSAGQEGHHVDPSIRPIYDQLVELKSALENLLVTHRWTLRETDLYFYQRQLQQIDESRVNGIFQGTSTPAAYSRAATPVGQQPPPLTSSNSNTLAPPPQLQAPKGQSILLYLLRRCYAIIYKLLESSEPVSEALTPIHNQLTTVRRCLLEVKRMGGLSSVRELYPYQMKLASIDQLRVDGKFIVGGTVPEGQGMVNALLSECFDICHELRVEMEENDSQ
ncbi:cu(2+) suppressing and bleomycin sensitive protein 1 [Trichomonascus vanleenenianus]|uniref:Cub1p n=1 Tax=Trichomonascus vanleenenianus TaxID=2268995 RepID=UPI003ECA5008